MNYPKVTELFPPGGFSTLDEGLSVSTFPQFILFPFAKTLFDEFIFISNEIKIKADTS